MNQTTPPPAGWLVLPPLEVAAQGTGWLTMRQACDLLHKNREDVMALVETGRLTAYRPPTPRDKYRHYRIAYRDVLRYLIAELQGLVEGGRSLPARLTAGEAAAELGVSRVKVFELIASGDLAVTADRSRRIPDWAVTAYLERTKEGAAQTA